MIPHYDITDDILINISTIEHLLAIINNSTDIYQAFVNKLHSENKLEHLLCFNELFNLGFSYTDVKKITTGYDVVGEAAQVLVNIRQIYEYSEKIFHQNLYKFDFQFVQHILKLLHYNILEPWEVGRIRSRNERPLERNNVKEISLDQPDMTLQLGDVISQVTQDNSKHPLIKACIFFTLINKYLPFTGLNYEASFLLFKFILDMYGYDSIYNLPILKCFLIRKKELSHLIQSLQNSLTEMTHLLAFVSQNLKIVLEEYKNKIIKIDTIPIILGQHSRSSLNNRQKKVLQILITQKSIKRDEYMQIFKVSTMTAYRDLNLLVQQGLLKPHGKGKATVYLLVEH
ncbi:MAG: hypothetical protein KatS3mg084_0534 [Candidatus Dojkabacteria bacterium]|nr:MAG: hypothetical protein KatS3mg084_0534 [Candidatus Dojkabacteria bacterium]